MFTHVVLLEPKSDTAEDDLVAALAHVQAMKSAIPGILAIATGKNLSPNHQKYTYGFVITFADAADFSAYVEHPAHAAVSAELQRLCQHIIDFDSGQAKTEGPTLLHALKAAYEAFIAGWSKAGQAAGNTTDYV